MAGRPRTVKPLPPEYQQQGEALFHQYRQRALHVAWKFLRRVPSWLTSREEIEAAALEGLWDAVLRDRPGRGDFNHFWIHPVSDYCRHWLAYAKRRYRTTTFSSQWSEQGGRSHEQAFGHHLPWPERSEGVPPRLAILAERALSLLTHRQQQLFILHYWHDVPLERAALAAGYSASSQPFAVRKSALKRLRRLLAAHVEEVIP